MKKEATKEVVKEVVMKEEATKEVVVVKEEAPKSAMKILDSVQRPLPDDVVCDSDFLESNKNNRPFMVYSVKADFKSNDPRHLNLTLGQTFCSFTQIE